MKILPWSISAALLLTQASFPAGVLAEQKVQISNVTAAEAEDTIVHIPDMNLKAALNYLLYKRPGDDILKSELESFEILNLPGKDIQSIEGLQYAVNVRELSLQWNNIEDITPIADLTSLKKLFLGGNNIHNLTPLKNQTSLTHLDISENGISDIRLLNSFTQLNYLHAEGNQISDLGPLANLTELTILYLRGNNISDITPLKDLVNLRTLGLSDNHISDLAPIKKMEVLGTLSLGNNGIEDISPLADMNTLLGDIDLSDNQIQDISPLSGLYLMYSLNLSNNQITDIEALSDMTRIQYLQLRNNKIRDLRPLKYILTNMKQLDLAYNLITDASVIENAGVYIRNASYEGNFIPYKDKQFQYYIPHHLRFFESMGAGPIEIPIELESPKDMEFDRSKGINFTVETKNGHAEARLIGDNKIILKGLAEGEEEVTLSFDNSLLNQTIEIKNVDLTAPEPPAVEPVLDNSGFIRGTAEKYSDIIIKVGNQVYETDTYNEGDFSYVLPLQKAGTEIEVFAKDGAGNISEAAKLIVKDVTGPGLYFYTGEVTDQSTEMKGKSEVGARIELEVDGSLIGEAVSNSEGEFTVSFPAQKAGKMIFIKAIDSAGNASSNSMEVRDRTAPSKPVISELADTMIKGQAEPGSSVQVLISGIMVGAGWAGEDGAFAIEIPSQEEGTKIEISAVDSAGNGSEAAVIIVPDKTAPAKPAVEEVNITDTIIRGVAEAGSLVEIKVNSSIIGTGTAEKDGRFSVEIPRQTAGAQLIITAYDASGNISDEALITVKGISFPDITEKHRFYNEISFLTGKEIITGFPDGSFRPNATVTRAQAAIMIGRALGLNGEQRETIFKDAGESLKASGYIAAATEKEIISGFPDGTFRPDAPVTRGQMAIFLARAFDLKKEAPVEFSDVSAVVKSYPYIKKILADRITTGYPDGTFRPDNALIRADFSAFMARALAEEFKVK